MENLTYSSNGRAKDVDGSSVPRRSNQSAIEKATEVLHRSGLCPSGNSDQLCPSSSAYSLPTQSAALATSGTHQGLLDNSLGGLDLIQALALVQASAQNQQQPAAASAVSEMPGPMQPLDQVSFAQASIAASILGGLSAPATGENAGSVDLNEILRALSSVVSVSGSAGAVAAISNQAWERSSPFDQYKDRATASTGLPPAAASIQRSGSPNEGKQLPESTKRRRNKKVGNKPPKEAVDERIGTVLAAATEQGVPFSADTQDSNPGGPGGRPFLLPCRARGMAPDHNFRYAHFVIPSAVQHGEELICSYDACRNAGIKFRYCSHCRVPVAKRNFNQRHSHGLPHVSTVHSSWTNSANAPVAAAAVAATFGDEAAAAAAAPPAYANNMANEGKKQKQVFKDAPATSSSSDNMSSSQRDGVPPKREITVSGVFSGEESKKKSRKHRKKRKIPKEVSPPLLVKPNPDIPLDRQWRWATLLGNRPDMADSDAMSAWLLQVMAISDSQNPLKQTGMSSLTYSSADLSGTDEEDEQSASSLTGSPEAGVDESTETEKLPSRSICNKNNKKDTKTKKKKSSSRRKRKSSEDDSQELSASFAEWKERKKRKSEVAARQLVRDGGEAIS